MNSTKTQSITELPSPKGLPLLGNILQIKPERFHQIVENWVAELGETLLIKLGTKPVVVISNPAMIAEIFRDRPHRFRRWRAFETMAKESNLHGLFTVEGEEWKRQRRAWMKALSIHQVKPFFEQIDKTTERLREHWLAAAKRGEAIDIGADLMHYTVDVTTQFAYGIDSNTLTQREDDALHIHLRRVSILMSRRATIPIPYWRWFRLPADRRLDESMDYLKQHIEKIIADARLRLAENPALKDAPTNLLEALLVTTDEEGKPFDDEEIFANTLTALTAGEDTTAHALSWIVHFLTEHPTQYERLQSSVDKVLGDSARWTNLDDSDALHAIDCILSEALRMKPVVPLMFLSVTDENTTLGNLELPAGMDLIIAPRVGAMNEETYADAANFCPQRWQQEQKKYTTKPPMPFGGGPRLCPGRSLATTEIKSVVAMLARNFDLETASDEAVTERMAFTLVPDNLRVRLKPRQQNTRA